MPSLRAGLLALAAMLSTMAHGQDDHGNTRATATAVAFPSSTLARINSGSDEDYFSFTLSAQTTLAIGEGRNVIDTEAWLYNSSGAQLATNDQSGGGDAFLIARTLNAGTYYVRVGSNFNETGEYALQLYETADNHGGTSASSTIVGLNSDTPGVIYPLNTDADYFSFTVLTAGSVTIQTTGHTDTFGQLYNAGGTQLASNDDSGAILNFLITRTLSTGTYYVRVTTYNNQRVGPYTLQIRGPNSAPSFGTGSVTNKTYAANSAIDEFVVPAASGGDGAITYSASNLPAGLVFDATGTDSPGCPGTEAREICGTPTTVAGAATVTITAQDGDLDQSASDRAALTFTVTVEAPSLVVRALRVSPNRLSLAEGGSGAYTVVLSRAPTGPVTVGVSSDNPAVTVSTSTLTFTTLNWNTARSVTVTAEGDADAVDEAATITNAASGGGYGVSGFVRVGVADDEPSAGTDYDADNDGLIDVDSLAKLNAMRWDVDGDGAPLSGNASSYAAAFPGAAADMGCPDGPDTDQLADACDGYALTADLDFDTDDDGDVDADDEFASWTPVVGWDATFDGRGHTISNLTVTGAGDDRGLFSTTTASSTIRALGLADARVSGRARSGVLAGTINGRVAAVYATGSVSGVYAVGGLAGVAASTSAIVASYSTATVECTHTESWAGAAGLVSHSDGAITASYSTGAVTGDCPIKQGLVASGSGTVTASYWDTGRTGIADDANNAAPEGLSTTAMQTPTTYGATASDVYRLWNDQDVDGDGAVDADPWDFGGPRNHPVLKWGGLDPADQRTNYDADGDRLIEISTLAQLNAVRWDLDGDGAPVASATSSYYGAFFNGVFNPSGEGFCAPTTDDADDNDCLGYELANDLDFDTDGDGQTHTGGTGDDGDAYYNADDGWVPIGPNAAPGATTHYRARFDGNGHVIDNLFVKRSRNYSGLFAALSDAAVVTSLGLPDAYVGDGQGTVGMLAGVNRGRVAAVWSSGSVTARGNVGGLVGAAQVTSTVVASYSTATVVCTQAGAYRAAGGLVGVNSASSTIAASYSTGTVTGPCGLRRAFAYNEGTVAASYWDTTLSQIMDDTEDPPQPPEGRTTAALQTPTDYDTVVNSEALYAAWDDQDVDGDGATGDGDDADPWDFGLSNQHPILKYRGLAAAPQLDAQPDTAPDFGTAMVSNKTFQHGRAIPAFQIPAAGAGNGVLTYAESGLPTGLVFDADGTGSCAGNAPRTVCGTPTATTTPVTVTITVSDSDSNEQSADQDMLTFTVAVVVPSAAISSPAALAEATLNNATVTVALTNAAFEVGATAANFTLTTNLPGLRVASVATVSAGDTSATLTLGYSGGNFNTVYTLAVTVADAAHTLAGALTTPTANIVPTPSVAVSRTTLTLTEGGSDGTYTVVLGGQPTGNVAVTVTSTDANVATVDDTDGVTPGTQNTLSFTPTNWNTARTVTVSPQDDDDAVDGTATINHAVSPGYGATAASVSVTVEDDETAAIVIDADPATANVADSGPIALVEGATSSTPYTVKLSALPTGTVTVTVTSTDTAAATVDTDPATGLQDTLSFTTGNWDTAQTAWLTPVDDTDPNSEEVDIRHEANGGGYNGVFAVLRADVADDDVGVIVDTDPNTLGDQLTALSLREGQTRTYRVRLSTLPAGGNVTVVATSANAAITATPGSLTFNAGNWQTARTVTVRAEHDGDRVGEWTDIVNEANGGQYSGETTTVRATAEDDEMSGTDYDADGDFLIEIDSLAKLNAVRWDLNGDGSPAASTSTYQAAFPGSVLAEDMGCLDGPDAGDDGDCAGYELMADLDFDTDNDGDVDADDPNSYANWAPIGGTYTAAFQGNGRTIANLTTNGAGDRGLFGELGTGSSVSNLGLVDVAVTSIGSTRARVGGLAAVVRGTVAAVHVRGGAVSVTSYGNDAFAGGLAGVHAGGVLRACHATAAVSVAGLSVDVGGLVGLSRGAVAASYATGAVSGSAGDAGRFGGLVGRADTTAAVVTNSYATGAVSGVGSSPANGGLVGQNASGTSTASYWNSETSGQSASALGTALTTAGLQTPTSATGTFAAWDSHDTNDDGTVDAADEAWDFGTAHNYPALKYGGQDPASQRNDYDADGDGLIEISTLAQLHAVRWDLDGDGAPVSSATSSYFAASGTSTFANAVFNAAGTGLACPTTTADADDNDCLGYELLNDLDFDTDGSGATHTSGTGDANDAWNNGGMGWDPIGPATTVTAETHFNARFDGNGKIIANLFVNRARDYSGLFAGLAGDAKVVALGLPDALVRGGGEDVGALVGYNSGFAGAAWSSGSVSSDDDVGGLVGYNYGTLVASYSTAEVVCTSSQPNTRAGGLVGTSHVGSIAASYSTGTVTGNCAILTGLAGTTGIGTIAASYWDTGLSNIAGNPPLGRSTAVLQAATDYDTLVGDPGEAIYATWDDQDVDGDGATGDDDDADPWDFGLSNQHPILKYRGLAAAPQLDAQPDTAPDFGTAMVSNKTFQHGRAIPAFQIPAAGAGNGVLTYAESGLPTGLVFDADGTGSCAGNAPRTVCGTPTATTTPVTVTITVSDSDSNEQSADQDMLTFTVAVVVPSAAITAPAALAEATLNGATVTVALTNAAFESGVGTGSFSLTTNLPGLRIASVATVTDGDTSATLTLGYSGGFNTLRTLAVRVADSAHTLAGALTTPTVNIVPTPSVAVSRSSLTLTEGGSDGTYTVVLGGQPTGNVAVTVTSTDANVATVDTDTGTIGLQNTLSFTPTNWNTARTVTVSPQDDDDALEGTATINHAVSPGYGATASSVSVTVEDDETAAIVIDADPSTATVVDSGPIALVEGATSTTPYAVKLSALPTGTVTVTVTSTDTAAATVDTDPATGLQNTLSFTTGNWDTAQTAWLTPVDDTDPNSEEVDIRHEANGGGYNGVFAVLRADVADDDVGVIVDTDPNTPGDQLTALSLREGGTRTYRVRLSTLPAGGNVTVTATSSNAAITATPGSLTFTAQNWQTARTVTVRAEQDDDAVGEWTDIANEANGAQYGGETTTVRATAEDDEMGGTDYDADGDFLIEIDSLAKLNAVRWDLDGDGDAGGNETNYRAAFAGSVRAEDMGCLDGPDMNDDGDCAGYELMADLDFDTDGDGDVDADDDYPNWTPIGGDYNATFHGNNRAISNLTTTGGGERGLFWGLGGSSRVSNLGLVDVSVTATSGPGANYRGVGALAGQSDGTIEAVYVRGGTVSASSGGGRGVVVGGLVGYLFEGVIRACYSTAAVSASSVLSPDVGGLVGHASAPIVASYAAGTVHVHVRGGTGNVGGLVGWATTNYSVFTNSYATGRVSWDGSALRGGLLARRNQSGSAPGSTWDWQTTGQGGGGGTTSDLQAPTSATGTFAGWNSHDTNDDGTVDAADEAWDFGSAHNYPALKYGGMDVAAQRNNYDADGDGLIEITSLAQLDAVRWDLDGDGAPAPGATSTAAYFTATSTFFNAVFNAAGTGLACPTTTADADDNDCLGYELLNDLDFDTDGSGATHTSGTGDANDAWNAGGMGWDPIGPASTPSATTHFNATFDGNGKRIDNLFVNRSRNWSGLFAGLAGDAKVVALGLPNARVQGGDGSVGALAGQNNGHMGAVWASGSVAGASTVGGLVGNLSANGSVVASYSTAAVSCTSTSGAGLVSNIASAAASIAASYSTGSVTGAACTSKAGLVNNPTTVTASYWDTGLSMIADDADDPPRPPEGKSTADLQAPTDYDTLVGDPGEAIYATWDNQDVDGDGATGDGDDADPWDFGRSNQHPILKYRGLAAAPQLDAQPDTAPAFATSTLAAMTFPGGVAIQPFLLPTVTAGNGAYAYTPAGLPAGLSLGLPNCATERTVCGTPTAATSTTVTVTVDDGDSNQGPGDRDAVTFAVTVPPASARIAGTVPTSLTETNLNGATVRVELSGTVFDARIAPSGFALETAPTINGLIIASATRTSDTEASLRLRFTGDFMDQSTLAVRVLAATHRFGGNQDTGTVAVMPAAQVMLSATELTLEEAPGSTNANVGTYTVVLTGQPPSTATVTPASSNGDVTTSGALSFTTTSWNTPQTVTVTAGRDDDAVDDVAHITHAVQGIPGVSSGPRVRVAVNDDDVQGLTLDAATLTASGVTEGMTATYTAVLDTEPTGPVTVAVSGGGDAVAVDADSGAPGDQATLLFNAANWDTPQTVTARAREDDDGEDGSATLTHDPSGADYGGVESVDVTFAVTDDDAKGADLSVPSLTVQENGTASYALVLSTEPVGGPVSVAVASSATSTVTASPPALTFTAENWDVPQRITLSGVDDANTTDDSATVGHTPTGADYGSGVTIADVAVTVADDDTAGLKVTPTSLTVAEGATATYTVRLNVAPTATTTVAVGGATAKVTADTDTNMPGDQWALIFDATNWNVARTVTVTAVADSDGADETVGLTHAVTGAGDYASVSLARRPGVDVRVTDAQTAGVVVEPTSLTIDEGGTAEYAVSLSAPPASGTSTVAIASSGAAGLTVATSTLLFDAANWDTAQTVTVTAVADHDRLTDAEGVLTHTVANYGAVTAGPDVRVAVRNTTVDHDADADGLIEIDSLAKLNAMRWDLDGDGTSATTSYAAVFPNPRGGAVCPTAVSGVACVGFELTADLDFAADGGEYDNGGLGWEPVGTAIPSAPFAARFNGNGRLVRNLFVNRPASYAGLFAAASGRIEAVGLPDARVSGYSAGALTGLAEDGARVTASWSTGAVSGEVNIGGLVGETYPAAEIRASYSTAAVDCSSAAANASAGGLAGGQLNAAVGVVTTSWAAGRVTGACPNKAGLVGGGAASATASYWDAAASGIPDDDDLDAPEGLSTADLRRPTDYEGVYANWNVDLDGDYEADDPWNFGSSSQYPSLKWRGFDATKQFVGLLSFASGVPGRSFTVGRLIALFEVPAAVGGEGTVRYSARGLPPGLVFDADGRGQCGLARSVCGTPSEAGTWTATVTARDGAGATAALTISMEVLGADAAPEEEPATVPDEALREAVARVLGRSGGTVTEGDLLSLEELDASWSGVSSLAGLSLATNLRRLVLGGNAVSDLSELSGLRLLAHLDLSDNAVSDLSALSGLTRLETLLLSGNRVSDLSPLRGMAELKALVLDGNAVSDLAHMVFLESLEELSLSGNPLEGLSPLCSLRELKWLWLAGSGLSDISELSCLTGLERLWLSDNAVEDVGPLSGMRRLAWLDLERNAVSGVDALRRLEALSRLRLGSNRVSDAGPLAANEGLGEGDVAGLRGNPLSMASIQMHVPALRERGVSVLAGLSSPWFASAGDAAGRQSFVRLVNRSEVAGEALVWGVDDAGGRYGPARLSIGVGRTAHFNSEDLEYGNAAKGLSEGLGWPGSGNWRLEILSTLDLEAQTLLRARGGPPSALHDGLPRVGETLRAAFLPAGRERSPAGALRVSNPTGADETVMVWGFDDAGRGRLATGLVAPAGRTVTVSASDLERWRLGAGRGLGRGEGNWRLELAAPWPLAAQALAVGDDGRTGNLSGPAAALGPGVVARVPLFPPASAAGRVGVARVWNLGAAAGEVLVTAVDDAGVRAGPVSLALEAFAAAEFDSHELEEGGGPLARGVGAPTRGSWRLELRAQFGARVHARAVGAGGYATGLLEAAPRSGGAARVSVFNPGSNQTQRSLLRLANDGAEDAMATIEGVDDAGRAGGAVSVTVPAGEALWLSASELEQGGDGLEGSLGDGEGKWRLTVSSSAPLAVMSLVEDEQGALSNLSTPGRR